jgi:hypothetical protein
MPENYAASMSELRAMQQRPKVQSGDRCHGCAGGFMTSNCEICREIFCGRVDAIEHMSAEAS